MIANTLDKMKDESRIKQTYDEFREEEKRREFFTMRIGRTIIRTTSRKRLEEYAKLYNHVKTKITYE